MMIRPRADSVNGRNYETIMDSRTFMRIPEIRLVFGMNQVRSETRWTLDDKQKFYLFECSIDIPAFEPFKRTSKAINIYIYVSKYSYVFKTIHRK